MHGVAFDCVSKAECSFVLLNNNGYVQVFREAGSERTVWYELQQWPHVLRGAAANRVQLAGNAEAVEVRVNNELLLRVPARTGGMVGVAARASAASQQVTFTLQGYVQAPNPRPAGRIIPELSWCRGNSPARSTQTQRTPGTEKRGC
ncbi:hypothetical protein EMGBS3_04940 [Anaerolineaceae bacterium]|nr:hypothetical protein EMGBS3_04940 [Anaerolineaceae bacterium]